MLLDEILPAIHRAVGGARPVDQPEVDVVRPQPLQRGVEVAERRLVPVILPPHLGRQEELAAVAVPRRKRPADLEPNSIEIV